MPAPERTRSREELLDETYAVWHSELASRAQDADDTTNDEANGVVDLTHPHPTGSALFSSGSPVRITSLVRERFAQQRAVANLQRLKSTTQRIAEMYGHAPTSLAFGRLTWTELPPAAATDSPVHYEAAEMTDEFPMIEENDDDPAADHADSELDGPASENVFREDLADDRSDSESSDSAEAGTDAKDADESSNLTADAADVTEAKTDEVSVFEADAYPREAVEVSEYAIFRAVTLKFDGDRDAVVRQLKRTDINPAVLRALRENGATHEQLTQVRQAAQQIDDLDQLLEVVVALGRMYLPGFDVESVAYLGCFERPERTMLSDLEGMEPYIRTSGIMMALAGDEETRKLSAAPMLPGGEEDRAPEVERGAGDLDVAELNAVEAVASGRSIVVDCPPGSKRTETMASICADAAASNRSILVVPARLSSGRQLIEELEQLGLGDLVLDFSEVDKAPQRIRTGLRLPRPELPTDETLELRSHLVETRRKLETFVDDLHREDSDWGTSVHDLLEKLGGLMSAPEPPQTRVRLGEKAIAAIKDEGIDSVTSEFDRAADLGAFDPGISRSAWANSTIADASAGAEALDEVRRLHDITVPAAISQSSRSAGETSMKQPTTLAQWFEHIDVLDGIADSLDTFVPRVFETSPMNMAIASAPKEWRDSHGHAMKMSDRRRYRKQALDLVRPGESTANLHEDLLKVQKRREIWRRYSPDGGWPTLPDGMAQIRATRAEVQRDLESLQGYLDGEAFFDMEFEVLQERLASLVNDADHMSSLPERNATLRSLRDRGFGEFLDDAVQRGVTPDRLAAELDLAYTSAVFEQMIGKSPTLASLGPRDLTELLANLRTLDRKHTETLSGPVLHAVVNNSRSVMQSRRQDTLKLDNMLAEEGTGGLRDAIATYARLVQTSRPVWVVPPTVLAEFIPPMPWVDLVIVEAVDSVATLISPMMRGRQAVVVADLRRPGGEAIKVFEDVLPVAELPTFQAEHDALSTFALKEIGYDLDAIPSVHVARESRLIYIDGRGVPGTSGDGAVESTQVEVDAVLDAVIEHAMSRPDETLAVVTLSVTHANRVREAVVAANSSDIKHLKRFVITDITRASGLKRDHIILSVGYGKTVHGRVLHTFGALASPEGLAGLIDAIAAAGSDLTIISALGPGDIDTRRVSTPGLRLLSRLIENAGGSQEHLAIADDDVAPLLADVANRLHDRGWSTRASYGYEDSPRIPLVVGHGNEYVVAVMLDDEDYVSERSLRRRDRFWVQALEVRGWSVFQTFSSSLFIDPEGQVAAIEELLKVRFPDQPEPVRVPTLTEDGAELAQGWNTEEIDRENPGIGNPDEGLRPRGIRPNVTPGLSLAAYTDDQLDDMIEWVASDGKVRGEDELVDELRAELGIERRGEQIDIVLRNVARRSGLIGVAMEFDDGAEREFEEGLEPEGDHVAHVDELPEEEMLDGDEALAKEFAADSTDEAEGTDAADVDTEQELPIHGESGPVGFEPESVESDHVDSEVEGQTDSVDDPAPEDDTGDVTAVEDQPDFDEGFRTEVDYEIVDEKDDGLELDDEGPVIEGDFDR